jgi:hypothetical protein
MSNKTPFEIRADLLKMAQEHLQQQYLNNIGFAQKAWETYLASFRLNEQVTTEQLIKAQQDWMNAMQAFLPKAPSFEDIINKAQELYGFVQKKD